MNEHNELIELLMGKFLDGEITPSEQRILDERLVSDPDARVLFDQLTRLHETSQEAVQAHILDQGPQAADIFARAWDRIERKRPLRVIHRIVFSQFTTGLAAGLLVAVGLFLWQNHQWGSLQNHNTTLAANNIETFSPERQVSLFEEMESRKAANLLEEMSPDDAADLIGDLSEDKAQELLEMMDP